MLNAFRLTRTRHTSQISSYTYLQQQITRKPSTVKFERASSSSPTEEMNPKEEPEYKARDTISSFGEAYATRADDEGFGGVYGGNQYVSKEDEDRDKGPKHSQGGEKEFDHGQGSEVKQKEKARNQCDAVAN